VLKRGHPPRGCRKHAGNRAADRRALIKRASRARDPDNLEATAAQQTASLIGLMADEPELVDEMRSLVDEARKTARMRNL
jgi:hypothetical protein